jgi:2-C-methyl-D-erythritol 4-phosphate cytidylyltransferase/2-C-methyl-D-erythritol 2,4-cyclodiphosphate synthase
MDVAAVVVAAGRGLRAGGSFPKQYWPLAQGSVIGASLDLFARHTGIAAVQPVIHAADAELFAAAAAGLNVSPPVFGGETRQASVRAGLQALAARNPHFVLVHDAVRPFASRDLVERALRAVQETGAAVPVLRLVDTIKTVNAAARIVETIDRSALRAVQTPQAFAFAALLAAHERAAAEGRHDFPDDAALAQWAGMEVAVFAGEKDNIKLTTADDLDRVAAAEMRARPDTRTGMGVDVHAFGPGDHVMLGGLRIPHERGLLGHSDADVVLHALTDALLGALAEGDIGEHFPPGDPRWRDASSDQFLAFAVERLARRGGLIANLDVTIVCEAPRLSPHRDAMRARIAAIAGIDGERVAVKATTSEQLGFLGRGEGIAALAMATVRLPIRAPGAKSDG